MSKIVELYVRDLTREGSTMTINDVPKKLRKQVEDAVGSRPPSLPARQPQTLAPRRKGRANDRPGPRVAIIKNCRKGGA